MSAKTVVVIGGTGGIGGEAARQIAAGGARVVIVGRSPARGEAAVARLQAEHPADHRYLQADMAHMADVARLADALAATVEQIDVLVHAAGVITWERQAGPDGVEVMFGTHVLSRVLLTDRVAPLLSAAPAPRVVIVSARVAPWERYDPDRLQATKTFRALRRLQQLQLANHLWATHLPERIPTVTAHLVHPGIVETAVFDRVPRWIYAILRVLIWPLRSTPEQAAANVARLAAGAPSPHGTLHTHPKRYEKQQPARRDAEAAAALRAVCAGLIEARGLG